jgi:hypothetical protein
MVRVKQDKCKHCKKPLDKVVPWQEYCRAKCRTAAYYARRAAESRAFRKLMEKR